MDPVAQARREAEEKRKQREEELSTKLGSPPASRGPASSSSHRRNPPATRGSSSSKSTNRFGRTPEEDYDRDDIIEEPVNPSGTPAPATRRRRVPPQQDIPRAPQTEGRSDAKTTQNTSERTIPDKQKNKGGSGTSATWPFLLAMVLASGGLLTYVAVSRFSTQPSHGGLTLSGDDSKYIGHEHIIKDGAQFVIDSLQQLRAHENCSELMFFTDEPQQLSEDQNLELHKKLRGIPMEELKPILSRRARLLYPDEMSNKAERETIMKYTMDTIKASNQVKKMEWSNGAETGRQWNGDSEEHLLLKYNSSYEARSVGCRTESWLRHSPWASVFVGSAFLIIGSITVLLFVLQ
eukprot:gb/GECG01009806.1/.p1 GENE.gb/GECG01009806.1/~~gb/GECG01009806.1/.p1  ORF type:complete len:350 (+),score=47.26 gb/GECG01009806.1/:1-1050(+)